ncbi:DNA-binding MurR/RpiR family transcriptional regulator [Pullulanibacillus pueri]|uniref:Putative HTH-type transcriptional regulator n=1 Tax=Pullulanibacillus pueri TaxID=1437324 RepID=A0A8J2ZTI7_9BACL|nr:MurR/RpiR family transcriptional regulator [Pullulanibacillus pueri]MBM7681842.1 DNA-binding MurR/RpiR family transcriptional regulator [Pullulanibacillus pueri]GGH76304.1 putative HTH-type transcriptional regulator [Pullulanibacillus pueri]
MLSGGLSRLKEVNQSLNPSEQKAAKYIIKYPEKMVEMTVSDLAEASGSSQSAIIRLCKSLGLKGYQDLKLRVAGDLQDDRSHGDEYKEIRPESGLKTIMTSVSNNNIYSINETLKLLDIDQLQKVIDLVKQAQRIDFYGTGASQLVAQDAQHKFMRINKVCTAYADTHLQLTSAVTLTENDVAFAISNSGETRQIIESIKAAKEAGAKTIGMTRYGNSTLGSLVDIHIQTLSAESDIRSAATSSRIVQLNILDILYVAIASQNYDESIHYLNRSREAIKKSFKVK